MTHIAVDTETLVGGGWPRPSADLENSIASGEASGIPVLVSSVTLTEVETIWLEPTGAALAKAYSTLANLHRDFNGLVPEMTVPNRDELRAAYQSAVVEVNERWQWDVVAPPAMTAQEIVELSERHQPPFRGKDTGFRDSYILMSVVVAAARQSEIGLVTGDNSLGESVALNSFAMAKGVTIRRFRTAREAFETIENEFHNAALDAIKAKIRQRSERLVEAVRTDRERLAEFVRRNLEIPPDEWKLEGKVQSVRSIEVVDVTQAHAGLPGDDERMTATATVSLTLELEFRTYTRQGPMGLREGQRDADMMAAVSSASRVKVATVSGEATLDVRVIWPDEDDELPRVEYIDVEYGNPRQAMDRKWVRVLLERA